MKAFVAACIATASFALVGCEALTSLYQNKDQIEAYFAAEAAGQYEIVLYKDGNPLVSEKWECTRGEDGKLSGCHKR